MRPDSLAECLACHGTLRPLGRRLGALYAACATCGAVQLAVLPDAAELEERYRSTYHRDGHYTPDPDTHLSRRRRVFEQVAERVAAVAPRGTTVVEIGAGWGGLGVVLRERGVPYVGWEPNPSLVRAARARDVDVRQGDLSSLEASGADSVGVLVSVAVFEHFLHPGEELRRMARLLTKNGAVVIQAPTAGIPRVVGRWMAGLRPQRELPAFFGSLAPPWHVHLPTPRSLSILARAADLDVREVRVSRSGRAPGVRGYLQGAGEAVGRAGAALFGIGWPLAMAHVFVLTPSRES